jgi:hypothetical protein
MFDNKLAIAVIFLCCGGCAVTPAPRERAQTGYRFSPQLPVTTPIQVFVVDKRPTVELEKAASTGYLYSGNLFAVEGNAKTVATDIGKYSVQFGGAQRFEVVEKIPSRGPAISFQLEHWYSRMPRKPEKTPILVTGTFGGTLTLYRDGKLLSSRTFQVEGTKTFLDTYIVFESEKKQTPKLIWNAMLQAANSAQQAGYRELFGILQQTWPVLQ